MIKIVQILGLVLVTGCGIYSPYGAATSGAQTFSVLLFEATHPLVSATSAQTITEAIVDRVQRQSVLKLVGSEGELRFTGKVVDWAVQPINVQGDETAGANRITITIDVTYTNTLDEKQSFQRRFSQFIDISSDLDLFSMEDQVVQDIGELLSQDVFNASLGNW